MNNLIILLISFFLSVNINGEDLFGISEQSDIDFAYEHFNECGFFQAEKINVHKDCIMISLESGSIIQIYFADLMGNEELAKNYLELANLKLKYLTSDKIDKKFHTSYVMKKSKLNVPNFRMLNKDLYVSYREVPEERDDGVEIKKIYYLLSLIARIINYDDFLEVSHPSLK